MTARILIIEDEEPLTTLLRYNLEAEGYDVELAMRGDEADLKLKENTPDLAVIDWMLPGLSGIELIRRLRARPETKRSQASAASASAALRASSGTCNRTLPGR